MILSFFYFSFHPIETYVCPETHFKCNNHFCIPTENVCDFQDNCGDNSDEEACSKCFYIFFVLYLFPKYIFLFSVDMYSSIFLHFRE